MECRIFRKKLQYETSEITNSFKEVLEFLKKAQKREYQGTKDSWRVHWKNDFTGEKGVFPLEFPFEGVYYDNEK